MQEAESVDTTQMPATQLPATQLPVPASGLASLRPPAEVSLRRTRDDDAAGLTTMLTGLSVPSAHFRFLTGLGRPSPRLVDRLLHRDATHGAWLAEIGEAVVGHAMWVLLDDTVELGVVVADAWQGHWIGRWLVQSALAEGAVAGAVAVRLDVHVENRRVVAILGRKMPDAQVTRDADLLTFRAPMTSAMTARPRRSEPVLALERDIEDRGQDHDEDR
jgi:GNAT superfamily N-acetyltransferase